MPLSPVQRLTPSHVQSAAVFSSIPGVTIKEVREFLGLPPLGDSRDELLVLQQPIK